MKGRFPNPYDTVFGEALRVLLLVSESARASSHHPPYKLLPVLAPNINNLVKVVLRPSFTLNSLCPERNCKNFKKVSFILCFLQLIIFIYHLEASEAKKI